MSGPDPNYDFLSVLQQFAPGVVAQREIIDNMAATYAANGFTPLTSAQVLAAVNAASTTIAGELAAEAPPIPQTYTPKYTQGLPVFPPSMKRFPDSNESPFDGWVEFGPWLQGALATS